MTYSRRISTQVLTAAVVLVPCIGHAQAGRALGTPLREAPETDEAPVDAETPSGSSGLDGWAFDLAAQTSLPLSIGIEAQLQTPIGLFFNLAAGHTPNAYLSLVADAVQGAGAFDQDIRPLLDEIIGNGGWNVRLGIGLNPVAGLELSFGYTYLGVNSAVSRRAIEEATGQRIRYRGMEEVPVSLELHALHGRIGYRFLIADHLVIRAGLGWTHTVSGSALVDVPPEVRAIEGNPATEIEEEADENLSSYGFTPELLLSAGYSF